MPRSDATLDDRARLLVAARRSVMIAAIRDHDSRTWRGDDVDLLRTYRTSTLVNICLTECVPVPGVPDGR